MKPDKIILWLGEDKFPERKLPKIFDIIKSCGVDIEFHEDLKAHTKYFHAMKEYPDDIIITFDDDFIYKSNIIETLYNSYTKHPGCVSAMRVHRIKFEDDGNISPYMSWEMESSGAKGHESYQYLATGVGGVLYPPHCLPAEAFNTEALKRLCLLADDIWLKFMELLNGTKVVPASDKGRVHGREAFGSQDLALWKSNNGGGENDVQIRAVLEEYGTLPDGRRMLDILKE